MRKSKADDLSGWITEISEDPAQRMTRLEADLDEAHGRISDRMEDLQRERVENDGLRGAIKAANNDYEVLQARVLPHLDTPDWPETDHPVDALIGDELAAQYGGWWA
jgi:hypothetical protein